MSIRSLLGLGVGHRLLSNVDESVLVQLELNEFDAHHNPESERSCPPPPQNHHCVLWTKQGKELFLGIETADIK
jgi:hypothetical protein